MTKISATAASRRYTWHHLTFSVDSITLSLPLPLLLPSAITSLQIYGLRAHVNGCHCCIVCLPSQFGLNEKIMSVQQAFSLTMRLLPDFGHDYEYNHALISPVGHRVRHTLFSAGDFNITLFMIYTSTCAGTSKVTSAQQ